MNVLNKGYDSSDSRASFNTVRDDSFVITGLALMKAVVQRKGRDPSRTESATHPLFAAPKAKIVFPSLKIRLLLESKIWKDVRMIEGNLQ